jgi:hypothetical protein
MRNYNIFNRTVSDMLQAKIIMTQLAMLCLEPNVTVS